MFAGQNVGIKEVSDQVWLVSFMQYGLGFFDQETGRITGHGPGTIRYRCARNGPGIPGGKGGTRTSWAAAKTANSPTRSASSAARSVTDAPLTPRVQDSTFGSRIVSSPFQRTAGAAALRPENVLALRFFSLRESLQSRSPPAFSRVGSYSCQHINLVNTLHLSLERAALTVVSICYHSERGKSIRSAIQSHTYDFAAGLSAST